MTSFKPRGVAGGGRLDLPQYSYLSPAQLELGLSLAICSFLLTILSIYMKYLFEQSISVNNSYSFVSFDSKLVQLEFTTKIRITIGIPDIQMFDRCMEHEAFISLVVTIITQITTKLKFLFFSIANSFHRRTA